MGADFVSLAPEKFERAAYRNEATENLVILAVKAACLLTASNVTILARLGIGGFRKFPEALHLCMRVFPTRAQ